MVKPVGGRGHTAPYKTMVVRIPVDLQERVEEIVEKFRDDLEVGITSVDPDNDKMSGSTELTMLNQGLKCHASKLLI